MAKKKSSAKQTKKASPKKAVKKAAPKKKSVIKKAAPKAAAKKKTVVAKKAAKKVVPKAAAKKSAPKKATQKSMAKKPAMKSPVKTAKKVAPKKAVAKSAAKSSAKPAVKSVPSHLFRDSAPKKILDLSDFVTPLDDRLIVQLAGAEKMTAGGLYIPDSVSDVSGNLQGTVVAAGRGHFSKKGHLRPMDVKVGDKIVFAEYAGSKIKIQNEDLVILRESDVMGVVAK